MNNIGKIFFIGILLFAIFRVVLAFFGLAFTILTSKFFWLTIGFGFSGIIVISFWDKILSFIDNIIFELKYALGSYKDTSKANINFHRESNQKEKDVNFEKVIKTEAATIDSSKLNEQNVNKFKTQHNNTSNQETYEEVPQLLTFSFIPELYIDYMDRTEKLGLEWMYFTYSINLTEEYRSLMEYYGPYWYPSAYRCDYCSDQLYKVVYPVGEEFQIETTQEGMWYIKRAFTCPICEIIYAPKPGYRYTDIYAIYKADNEPDYRNKVRLMGVYGTISGRPDI